MRALVLSGGGSKGQYHVGVIKRLIGELETKYDVLCGVSVGALIVSFLAQYKLGEEKKSSTELEALFTPITNKDIWQNWSIIGKAAGTWKPSFLNSAPLQKLVKKCLDPQKIKESGKKLRIGAVSLVTGTDTIFDEHCAHLESAVLASSAFPAMFLPVSIEKQLFTDGGVRTVTPVASAIEAGAKFIDVVMASPSGSTPWRKDNPNAIDIAFRSIDLMGDEIVANDIAIAQLYNEICNLSPATAHARSKKHIPIRVIRPDAVLNDDSLRFDPSEARELQLRGYADALALEANENS